MSIMGGKGLNPCAWQVKLGFCGWKEENKVSSVVVPAQLPDQHVKLFI